MRANVLAGRVSRRGMVRLHVLAAMAISLAAVLTWAVPLTENSMPSPAASCRVCNAVVATYPSLAGATLTPATSTAYDLYAAIAYCKSSRSWGYGYNYGTREGAESAALARCGRDCCEVVAWVENGCTALAVGDGGAYGWSFRYGTNDLNAAISQAISQCSTRTTNCSLATWTCTDR